jgi:protein-disulfide isomerase-like protein with CxxC motif
MNTIPYLGSIQRYFYQENADIVSAGVLAALTKDSLILDSFLNRVADEALSKASSEVRKRIMHLIVH